MWSQLKRLLKSSLGKIAVLVSTFPLWKLLYNTIDAWGNGRMIWDSLPSISQFLNSTAGPFVVMLIGFALIALQLHRQSGKQSGVPLSGEGETYSDEIHRLKEELDRLKGESKRNADSALMHSQGLEVRQSQLEGLKWLREIADADKKGISA